MVDTTTRYPERSRTHRLLRYMFRMNQCFYCFAVECIIALLIILFIILCCTSINTKLKAISRVLDENKILDEYKHILPFIGCQYKKPLDFSTVSCGEDEDSYAFISRFYESASNDYRCVDRLDVLPCLSTETIAKFNYTRLQNFTQCAGLKKIKLRHYFTRSSSILAPSIDISKHQGRILRVKDFMVRCPKCAIRSYFGWRDRGNDDDDKYAKSSERCAREIKTFTYGWPQHARFCDGEEEHEVTDFCRIHELLRDKLSIRMDQATDFIDYSESVDKELMRDSEIY
ncbi:DNA ligase [Dirofilaria immitis]